MPSHYSNALLWSIPSGTGPGQSFLSTRGTLIGQRGERQRQKRQNVLFDRGLQQADEDRAFALLQAAFEKSKAKIEQNKAYDDRLEEIFRGIDLSGGQDLINEQVIRGSQLAMMEAPGYGVDPSDVETTITGLMGAGFFTEEGLRQYQRIGVEPQKVEAVTDIGRINLEEKRGIISPKQADAARRRLEPEILREDVQAAKKEIARAGKTDIAIDVSEKSLTKLGQEMAKNIVSKRDDAIDAVKGLENLFEAKNLINSGIITGTGAEYITSLGNFLSSRLGFKAFDDPVANTQAYMATVGNQVGRIIKQFGAGTGLSDADRQYAERIAGGKVNVNEKAIRRILDINEKAYRNVIKNYNKIANQAMSKKGAELLPFDLRLEIPRETGTQPTQQQQTKLIEFLGYEAE